MSKTKELNNITKKLGPKKSENRGKTGSSKGKKSASKSAGARGSASSKKRAPSSARRSLRRPVLTLKPWQIFAALGALLLVVLIPYIIHKNGETGARVPEGNWTYTIDISHHNSTIVWDSLAVCIDAKGRTSRDILKAKRVFNVSSVLIKATEGIALKDSDFENNWSSALSHNVKRGAYHFFRSSKDPSAQARSFIETVGPLSGNDLPPVLDIETIHKGCTGKQLSDKALVWLKAVESHYGVKPVVYTGDWFLKTYLSKEITDNYPIWIARYNTTPPEFNDWILWQFTDEAVVRGIRGKVDLSVAPIK